MILPSYTEAELPLPPYEADKIPNYTPSLVFSGVALLKKEFDTPWLGSVGLMKAVFLELNSNQLNIYELKDKAVASMVEVLFHHQNHDNRSPRLNSISSSNSDDYVFDGDAYGEDSVEHGPNVFGKLRKKFVSHKAEKKLAQLPAFSQFANNGMLLEPTSDVATATAFARYHRGKMLHSFTLLNLQVGEAPSTNSVSYKEDQTSPTSAVALLKYRNTLRLRIEYCQILLHFWSFYSMVHWYRNLCIGRDLASSLDTRNVTRLKSIPRDYSASNIALLSAAAREALGRFQGDSKRSLLYSESSTSSSSDSDSDSVMSRCTNETACTNYNDYSVEIYGTKIACLEEYFSPVEKQYITNCIPVLNLYDKWVGLRVTVLNYERMLPKNDALNVNENGRVFILPMTFSSVVKTYQKQFKSLLETLTRACKEYYVDDKGLVSIDCQ
uniref:Uncharacterized protein n=1 Tax=Candidozyma auris TaxID=498019 RepID=A0A0L0NYW7_CANAR